MELYQYVIRRFIYAIPILLVVTILAFAILHLAPGDPVYSLVSEKLGEEALQAKRHELGLDQPLVKQYLLFMKQIFTGKSYSYYRKKNVFTLIGDRLPNTLSLTLFGFTLSYLLALPMGIIAALHRGKLRDTLSMVLALIGVALPAFWLGLMLIVVFAGWLRWFPVGGAGTFRHLVLPGSSLALQGAAVTARVTRSSMLDVLQRDYITTAKAKGLSSRIVLWKHALRNAMIPVISILGLRIGWLIGGAVVTESVFARAGVGRLLVTAVYQKDYPVVQTIVLLIAASVVCGNVLADVLCAIANPRIRYGTKGA